MSKEAIKNQPFLTFIMNPTLVGAVVLAAGFASPSAFGQMAPSYSNSSSYNHVTGFSESEKLKFIGVLRTAAYGANVAGGLPNFKLASSSATSLKTSSGDKTKRPKKDAEKPMVEEESECWFQVPERFSLSKALPDVDPCTGLGTLLIADTKTRILYLCKNGKAEADYDLAIGWEGVQKRAEGDEKTPLGIYDISPPRDSKPFAKFIHIQYPTPQQERLGYTGSAVGIHGPSRWARCLGRLNTFFNWTNGCLAVAGDKEINQISRFVEQNKVKKLAVYPLEETGNSL